MRRLLRAPWAILLPILALAVGCATEPDNAEPDNAEPDDTEPDDTEPDDTKPDDTKPDDTKPDDTKPDDTEPAVPEVVDTEDQTSPGLPSLAMNPDGTALVVWARMDGASDEIWSNRYTPQAGWGTAQPIEDSAGIATGGLRVAIDTVGNGIAVWGMSDGTAYHLWASRYTSGVGWGPTEPIESDLNGDAGYPDLAMDGAGNALVTWSYASELWANRFEPGNGWATAALLENSEAASVGGARIAANADGDAVIVYGTSDGTNHTLMGKRYTAGTGWAEATLINSAEAMQAGLVTASNTMSSYQVAMAGDGTALAVWESQGHPGSYMQGARCSAAGNWELYSTPQDSEGGTQPQLAFSATGEVIVAWTPTGFLNTTNAVRSSRYQPSVGWGALEFVQENGSDYPQDLRLASGTSGHAVAVWSHANDVQTTLWLNRFEPDSGWGTARQLATTPLYPQAQVAVDAAGNALLVWLTGDDARLDLVAQEFPSE